MRRTLLKWWVWTALSCASWGVFADSLPTRPIPDFFTETQELDDQYVYVPTSETNLTWAVANKSALRVKDGTRAILYLPNPGQTVTVIGADAYEEKQNGSTKAMHGARPAIEVPSNSTLIVCGVGTLVCTGGMARAGNKGGTGEDGVICCGGVNEAYAGRAGAGGWGGGGGAPGIGGVGGDGGAGGAAGWGSWVYKFWGTGKTEEWRGVGPPGGAGARGGNGTASGRVYAFEPLVLKVVGGTAGKGGNWGDQLRTGDTGFDGEEDVSITDKVNHKYQEFIDNKVWQTIADPDVSPSRGYWIFRTDFWMVGGSGSGGGGGGGSAPHVGIGGGGSGGGGGGGGGCCGMAHLDAQGHGKDVFRGALENRGPSGGMGGGGLSRNQTDGRGHGSMYGSTEVDEKDGFQRKGGAGGLGGDYGDYGNDGGFSVVSGTGYDRGAHINVTPNQNPITGMTLDTELKFSVTLVAGEYGTFKDTGTSESTREFTFGTYARDKAIGVPTRVGYTFMGFYDQPNADNEKEPKGLMFVDGGGYPCRPWLYPEDGRKLYALWFGEGPILTVTNPGASGAHSFFETLQTLKTTREPGKKILFDLPLGSNTVKLPQGTPFDFSTGFQPGETVTVDGSNGGRGVTIRGDGTCSAFSCGDATNALVVLNLTFDGCGLVSDDPLHPNDTGAICGRALAGLVVDGCRFTACRSRAGGAAIDVGLNDGATVTLAYTTFEACQAKGDGGAFNLVSAYPASLSVDNCRFADCSAGGAGGAISAEALSELRMFGTTVYGCTSGGTGAALRLKGADSTSVLELVNVSVCDCVSEKSKAGAILVSPGHLVLANVSVLRNRLPSDGAQVVLSGDSSATVVNAGVLSASGPSFRGGSVTSYASVFYKDPSQVDDVYGTRISSRTVGGIVQSGYLPIFNGLAAESGTDVWYNPEGLDLVIVDPETSAKVTLVGDAAAATKRLTKDLFGRSYGGEGLHAEIGAIWGGEICVTSNLDDDGPHTLRTAMGLLRNGYIVTFDLPDGETEIVLREEIALAGERMSVGFTVDGENGGRGVTVSGGGATRLFSVGDGQVLTLENLTLNAGCTSGNGGLAVVAAGGRLNATNCRLSKGVAAGAGGAVWVEGDAFFDSCSFDGSEASNGGAAGCETGGSVAFVNCTLEGNKAETRGGGVYSRGTAVVANCTMVDNVGMGTAIASYGGQGAAVNSIFVSDADKTDSDVLAEMTAFSLYHVLVGVNEGAVGDEIATGSKDRIFLTDHSQGYSRNGVAQLVWRLSQLGSACEKGVTVFRDADCRNVACLLAQTAERQAFEKTAVWGDATNATDIISSDITAFTFSSAPSYGSYQTRIDEPSLQVTSSDDFDDPTDGFVTLREAVAFARAYRGLKDPTDGLYHIDILTTDNRGRPAVLLDWRNNVIIEGLDAPVVIRGAGNAPCSISGSGEYRALYVSEGQSLRVENLMFTNCFAQGSGSPQKTDGGAILNAGILEAVNCRFSDCRGDPLKWSNGGAVCTLGGATTTVSRCTFADCTATCGGAVANLDGGVTVATACTFRGNSAEGSGGGLPPSGGALYGAAKLSASRLLAANCTFVSNTVPLGMGGAVAAVGGAKATHAAVALANSILIGNPAKYAAFNGGGSGADLYSDGSKVRLAFVRYGGRNALGDSVYFDTKTETATAAELFATVTAGGEPIAATTTIAGVEQVFYPVLASVTNTGGYVRYDAAWENVAVYSTVESTSAITTLFGNGRIAHRGEILKAEICGGCEEPTKTIGSTSLTEEPEVPRKPDDEEDPLVVKNFTEEALRKVIAMASADPSLAKDGRFVVSFDGPGTVWLTEPLSVAGFSELPLVIRGPATLNGDGATGLIELADGNELILENLTLAYGSADAGGAVYAGEGTRLTAENCLFFKCVAEDGGAVCFDWPDSEALFRSCTFTGCEAEFTGGAIYQAGGFPLIFLDCTFSDNVAEGEGDDVYVPLRAAVEKLDGTLGVFGTVAEACSYAKTGDTLIILSEDADDPANYEAAKKRGVNVEIRTGGIDVTALTLGRAEKAVRFGSVSFSSEPTSRPKLLMAAAFPRGANEVTATLTGVMRGLWYGLGRSVSVDGEYVVENWVWAEKDGVLTVRAPKSEPTGFYRIKVSTKGE